MVLSCLGTIALLGLEYFEARELNDVKSFCTLTK